MDTYNNYVVENVLSSFCVSVMYKYCRLIISMLTSVAYALGTNGNMNRGPITSSSEL